LEIIPKEMYASKASCSHRLCVQLYGVRECGICFLFGIREPLLQRAGVTLPGPIPWFKSCGQNHSSPPLARASTMRRESASMWETRLTLAVGFYGALIV
jgi:hypothetical protein